MCVCVFVQHNHCFHTRQTTTSSRWEFPVHLSFQAVPTLPPSSAHTFTVCHLFARLHEPCADLPPGIHLHQHPPRCGARVYTCVRAHPSGFNLKEPMGAGLLELNQVWIVILASLAPPGGRGRYSGSDQHRQRLFGSDPDEEGKVLKGS